MNMDSVRRTTVLLLAASALAVLAGCSLREFPQSALHPRSEFALWGHDLNLMLALWATGIFIVVQTLLIVAVVKFRNRPGATDPKPVHGHTVLEIAWTIAPAVILAFVAVPTVLNIYRTQGDPPESALRVKVIGHQWWWEFKYPDLGVTTASEMHVPVGRPVAVDIETADVLHSFWLPAMGGKRDAVPARTNRIWFTADSVGTYPGQCAEFCGVSHANMRMMIMVESPAEFDAWVAHQKSPPFDPGGAPADTAAPAAAIRDTTMSETALALAAQGKAVYTQSACIGCHTIEGVSAGVLGPNLTHFGSRTSIAGAMYANDAENLGKWLTNPQERKPGSLMLNLALTPQQVAALVAYLHALK